MLLEEELNYSKKQSRSRINALMRETDQARTKVRQDQSTRLLLKNVLSSFQGSGHSAKKKASWQLPPIMLDVGHVERQFSETEEAKRMIVHEQLQAMERWVWLEHF